VNLVCLFRPWCSTSADLQGSISAQATRQQPGNKPAGLQQSRSFSSFPRTDDSPRADTADLTFAAPPVLGRESSQQHGSGAYAHLLEAQVGGRGTYGAYGTWRRQAAHFLCRCDSSEGWDAPTTLFCLLPPSQASLLSPSTASAGDQPPRDFAPSGSFGLELNAPGHPGQALRSVGLAAVPGGSSPPRLPASQRSSAEHLRPSPFGDAPQPPGSPKLVHRGSLEHDYQRQPDTTVGPVAPGPAVTHDTGGVAGPVPSPQMSTLMSGWVPDEEQTD
jgi:hypothetical protein